MALQEQIQAAGLDYDKLLAEYQDILDQTGNVKAAEDHLFFLSEGWEETGFTLPELYAQLASDTEKPIASLSVVEE